MSIRKIVPIERAQWSIEPAPSWVEPREPDWELPPSNGYALDILLVDEQRDVATGAFSFRNVRRLSTHAAVQALSQVELDFDPASHRLVIHDVAVWRRGPGGWARTASLTTREAFLLRQREQQLEQQILNGRVSLVALLEDVRVGDAIDLAWTLEPCESLPDLRFGAFFAFVWTVPVGRAYFSLRLDPTRPVTWRVHAPEGVAPSERIAADRATWSSERPPHFVPEPNVPAGYWPFPVIDVSGWTAWSEVAGYFSRLWADALAEGADRVAAEAARLRTGRDLLGAARAAVRFVQEEVRYLAVDFGQGAGMLPNGAHTVLRRRFGDCKDKALLWRAGATLSRACSHRRPRSATRSWRSSRTESRAMSTRPSSARAAIFPDSYSRRTVSDSWSAPRRPSWRSCPIPESPSSRSPRRSRSTRGTTTAPSSR
jgi:hypothetical protein